MSAAVSPAPVFHGRLLAEEWTAAAARDLEDRALRAERSLLRLHDQCGAYAAALRVSIARYRAAAAILTAPLTDEEWAAAHRGGA